MTWREDSLNHLKEVLSETLTLRGFDLVNDSKQKVHADFKLTDEKYYQTLTFQISNRKNHMTKSKLNM